MQMSRINFPTTSITMILDKQILAKKNSPTRSSWLNGAAQTMWLEKESLLGPAAPPSQSSAPPGKVSSGEPPERDWLHTRADVQHPRLILSTEEVDW